MYKCQSPGVFLPSFSKDHAQVLATQTPLSDEDDEPPSWPFKASKRYKKIAIYDSYKTNRLETLLDDEVIPSDIASPFASHRILREYQMTQKMGTYVQCCNPKCQRWGIPFPANKFGI